MDCFWALSGCFPLAPELNWSGCSIASGPGPGVCIGGESGSLGVKGKLTVLEAHRLLIGVREKVG